MKLVLTLVARDVADALDAQIAFHLNAGVDFVIATDAGSGDGTTEILESYVRAGCLRRLTGGGDTSDVEARTRMLRLAATEHDAGWVIDADPAEFWWPRDESLKDTLAVIPPRYTVVQGLERIFPARAADEPFFADRLTVRPPQQPRADDSAQRRTWPLRPVYRADPHLVAADRGALPGGRHVPLRAWYPVEVLRFPVRAIDGGDPAGGAAPLDDDTVARGLADGSLVSDVRVRDALNALRIAGSEGDPRPERQFELPREGEPRLAFRPPDVVDDAAYAVECAAVGEVDIRRLEEYIGELEARIGILEARFWPRVLRGLSRLVRRSARPS
jgi:hypothetical protein